MGDALAGTMGDIHDRPDLALEDVLKAGDGKDGAQQIAGHGSVHKRGIARIGRNVDAQVRARRRDVQAKGEALNTESFTQESFGLRKLIHGDSQIKVQADHWVCVGIHGLPVDHAIAMIG